MIDEILKDAEAHMGKSVEALRIDLRSVRTGRATPSLIEHLSIEYYGMPTPLLQIATIRAPEARLLTITPFSASDLSMIEKSILRSDLGLNPNNDGKIIRLAVPPLTEERRRDLVRQVQRRVEEARVSVRNIRRDAINDMREAEKEKMVSEDELHRGMEEVQKVLDKTIEQIEAVGRQKEADIMEI